MAFRLSRAKKIFACDLKDVSSHSGEQLIAPNATAIQTPPTSKPTGKPISSPAAYNSIEDLGQHYGYMSKPPKPTVVTVFVSKGGVLKTSLTLNLARMAARHQIRTLVIGLDMQCDITQAIGLQTHSDESTDFNSAVAAEIQTSGLADHVLNQIPLPDLIQSTDLPYLDLIPETPELVALDQTLALKTRREYWLRDQIIRPLRNKYDLIILDCSPNWNHLITNALVVSDVLLSPLECKITNFRNVQMFRRLITDMSQELDLNFLHLFVPTRLSPTRKLSREIFDWYLKNIPNCLSLPIRENLQGEEATAMHLSVPEYAPGTPTAIEMNQVLRQCWIKIISANNATLRHTQTSSQSEEVNHGLIT